MTNITSSDNSAIMAVFLDSNLITNNFLYKESSSPLADIISSTASISQLEIRNINLMIDEEKYLIYIYNSYSVSVSGLTVLDINQESGSPLFIDRSVILKLEHTTISNLSMTPLIIKNSKISLMDNVSISYFQNRVEISHSEIEMISNSVFSDIHSTQDLFFSNSNASIINSQFLNNSAKKGGAIFYSCPGDYK